MSDGLDGSVVQGHEALLVALAAHQQHAGARRRGIGGQGQGLADAHARGIEGLEQGSPSGIAGLTVRPDRGIGREPVGGLQERFCLGDRQDEGQLPGPAHGRQMGCGIARAEVLSDQELVQAPRHRNASRNGRSGIAALIESGDVIPDVLQADIVQAKAVLIEPDEIAVEIVGVGDDGAG